MQRLLKCIFDLLAFAKQFISHNAKFTEIASTLTHCDSENEQIQATDQKLLVFYHHGRVNLCENKLPW